MHTKMHTLGVNASAGNIRNKAFGSCRYVNWLDTDLWSERAVTIMGIQPTRDALIVSTFRLCTEYYS